MLKNIKNYVDGQKRLIAKELQERVDAGKKLPSLLVVQTGDNPASNRYVANKVRDCNEVGIPAAVLKLGEIELSSYWRFAGNEVTGVIIQEPVYDHSEGRLRAALLREENDVDGFLPSSKFVPATARGIMDYMDYCGLNWNGKNVVVVGRSKIVGKPVYEQIREKFPDSTVTLCHSKTQNLEVYLGNADLVICAVGIAGFIDCGKLKRGCVVIDVGINFNEEGKMVGDCIPTEGVHCTPVPGGVGLLTRLGLLKNLVEGVELW